jgi:HSP20 family protein
MLVTKKVARTPFLAPFTDVVEPMNRFAKLFEPFGLPVFAPPVGVIPPIDIVETPEELVLTAELPGMNEKEIEIVLEGNALTIRGEKKATYPAEEEALAESWRAVPETPRYVVYERAYGAFVRTFTLPATVDAARIRAAFEHGVLKIVLPKAAEARGRKIEIGKL